VANREIQSTVSPPTCALFSSAREVLYSTGMNLPDAAAKLTKKNRLIFTRWNAEVRKLLEVRGAVVVSEYKAGPDSLIGYDALRFELETVAGKLWIAPSGNWLACRFDDPARAEAFLRTWMNWSNLNPYSGKWNFHYFGADFEESLAAVRELLDGVTKRKMEVLP